MAYCNHCGRFFCSNGDACCLHCCRNYKCVQSIVTRGPQGPIGPQGVQGYTPYIGDNDNWYINGTDTGNPSRGPQGIQGDSATNYTTVHLSAHNTSGISLTVPVEGIAVPLPSTVINGFSANETFDTFTADYAGVFLLMYNVKMSANTTVKTRLTKNGTLLSGTVRSTSVPSTNYSLSLLIRLEAEDQLQLQLYDLNNVEVALQGGTGASLVLVRLSE